MKKISLILVVCALLGWSSNAFALGALSSDLSGSTLEVNGNLGYYDGLPSTTASNVYIKDDPLISGPFFVYAWPSSSALAQIGASEAKSEVSFDMFTNSGFYYPSLEFAPTYGRLVEGYSSTCIVPHFTATANETVIASINILGDLNITTEYLGDYGYVHVFGYIELWNKTTDLHDISSWSQTFQIDPWAGSDSLYQTIDLTLTSSLNFSPGDEGYLDSYVGANGTAFSIVPSPSAVLLATLGLSFAGWKLRNRA